MKIGRAGPAWVERKDELVEPGPQPSSLQTRVVEPVSTSRAASTESKVFCMQVAAASIPPAGQRAVAPIHSGAEPEWREAQSSVRALEAPEAGWQLPSMSVVPVVPV